MSDKIAELFGDFDFSILDDPAFKEDAVREEIIKPLLNALGYSIRGKHRIVRSKALEHPIVKVGTRKRAITNYPDYLLQVELVDHWVLDAKAPDGEIKAGENVEQAFFYAIHPDVRVPIYALCNGKEFIAFHVSQKKPLIYFHISEIEKHWEELKNLLSPEALGGSVEQTTAAISSPAKAAEKQFDYLGIIPPKENRTADKQSAKRHFGVHGYFTKQPYNVVQEYIKTFTRPGDIVLDPFGGTGVTVIEALMLGRKGIHIDLNPLSVFIVKTLIAPIDYGKLFEAYEWVQKEFEKRCPRTPAQVRAALKKYPYPNGIRLMKDADVEYIEELFSSVQLAQLAYLKYLRAYL